MNQVLIKVGIMLSIIGAAFSSGWIIHGWKYAAEQLKLNKELIAATARNDEFKTQLGVKHEQERKEIANAAATLAAGRVRLPVGCLKTDAPSGSAVSVTGTGEFSDSHQEALDRFKRGMDEVAKDADEMLATCRVIVEWAKKQGLPD